MRILGAELVPPLGAEDLRRSAGDAHDVGDLGVFAPEGLIEKLALEPSEFNVVRADVSEYVCLAAPEPGFVVHFDQGNLRIVHELDARNDSVARGRQKDEVLLLGDKVLQVGEFGRDVAAVAVDEVVGEADCLAPFLEAGLEVGVERHLEVGDRDADLLVRRRRSGTLREPLCGGGQLNLSARAAGTNPERNP